MPTCLSDRTGLGNHNANCWSRSPLLSVEVLVFNLSRIPNVLRFYAPFFQLEEISLAHTILSQLNPLPSYFSKLPFFFTCLSVSQEVCSLYLLKIKFACLICFPTCYTSSSSLHWQFNRTLISKSKRCGTLLYLINFSFLGPIIILSVLLAHNLCSDSNRLQICALYVPHWEKSATA